MKQWGTEGLVYLSLDADVTEALVHNSKSLEAVLEAAIVRHETGVLRVWPILA